MSSHTAANVAETAAEDRLARKILMGVVLAVLLAALLIVAFGWPMLGIIGLAVTLTVFALMIAFTLGG